MAYRAEKGNKFSYRFELQSRAVHFVQEIDFVVLTASSDSIVIEAFIKKGEFENDSIMTADYRRFVNTTHCFSIDQHGKILNWCTDTSTLAATNGALNARFFFPAYTGAALQQGSRWKNEDKIQDLIFDTMAESYEVQSIDAEQAVLNTDYELYARGSHAGKGYTGHCTVDVNTGLLLSADFHVSITGGGGTISIKKIK